MVPACTAEDRRHELAGRLSIDDHMADLARLLRHQPAPDGVALGPEILPLVIEALALLVDHDAERHAVDAGDDAAVEPGRAPVDRDGVALRRIADLAGAAIQQRAQQQALIVGRAADDEIVRHVAPVLLQPGDVRLEPARGATRVLARTSCVAPFSAPGRDEAAVFDRQILRLGVVDDTRRQASAVR